MLCGSPSVRLPQASPLFCTGLYHPASEFSANVKATS